MERKKKTLEKFHQLGKRGRNAIPSFKGTGKIPREESIKGEGPTRCTRVTEQEKKLFRARKGYIILRKKGGGVRVRNVLACKKTEGLRKNVKLMGKTALPIQEERK